MFDVTFLISLALGQARVNESSVAYSANVSFPTNYYGVDVSQSYGTSTFKCLKEQNLLFAIIRCYRSIGSVDPACAGSAAAANAAGLDVHAYMFPCPKCGDPAGQVASLVKYWVWYAVCECVHAMVRPQHRNFNLHIWLQNTHSVNVKRLWLDIEGSQYWTGNHDSNQAFYKGLIDACSKSGLVCGVYSSASQWEPIFGSRSFSYGSNLPLWYAQYDGKPSFSGWAQFGGWQSPAMKQFTDRGTKCSCSYDISWSPSLP